MSEGEEFISDFLESENIKFEQEFVISNLINDSKKHRKADFYIPKYKVYVEFFGQWNVDNHKKRYREKKKSYSLNNVPCIYLYPENLGIIEYVFYKRLISVLKENNMKNELFKYRLTEIWKERNENIIYLIMGFLIVFFSLPIKNEENKMWFIVGAIITIVQLYKIISTIKQIFNNGPKNRRILY